MINKKCSVQNCKNMVVAKGLCRGHYSRLRKTGQLSADIPLNYIGSKQYYLDTYLNKKYGRLTFIEIVNHKNGKFYWRFKCDCGVIIIRHTEQVISNNTRSCGCARREDHAGKKYGMLTFTKFVKMNENIDAEWEAICDCGNILIKVPSLVKSRKVLNNCGCQPIINRKKFSAYEASARYVWGRYKDGNIDFDTFLNLSQQCCYYCGKLPEQSANANRRKNPDGNFKYNGLDRIDSTKRHTLDNVVPCCIECNQAKNDLTLEEFLSLIEKIYRNTRKLRNIM